MDSPVACWPRHERPETSCVNSRSVDGSVKAPHLRCLRCTTFLPWFGGDVGRGGRCSVRSMVLSGLGLLSSLSELVDCERLAWMSTGDTCLGGLHAGSTSHVRLSWESVVATSDRCFGLSTSAQAVSCVARAEAAGNREDRIARLVERCGGEAGDVGRELVKARLRGGMPLG